MLDFKVQEWFKNRRKKDKLLKERTLPKKRGRPSTSTSSSTAAAPTKKARSAEVGNQPHVVQRPHHHGIVQIDAQSLLSQFPQQQTVVDDPSHLASLTPTVGHMLAATDSSAQLNLHLPAASLPDHEGSNSTIDTVAGHELQVASSIELTM